MGGKRNWIDCEVEAGVDVARKGGRGADVGNG